MCGIGGMINCYDEVGAERVKKSLKRRGPDQDGILKSGGATLIHARLAIIDLEHGLQPMTKEENKGRFSLVYNGEIYNTEDVRKELKALGHSFYENSDTEVVLKSYMEWGRNCVQKLNGIFAFAVWDGERLFIARDRMGVKPFFYSVRGTKFVFGSEIKALLESGFVKPQINKNSLAEIMLIGPGRTPGYGVFKGIEELPKACCGYFEKGKLRTWNYWEIADRKHTESFEETVENLRFLVTDSILRQTVSDVPLCTFLSGGLDSSIISAITAKKLAEKGERLHTFEITYEDNDKYFKKSKFQPNTDSDFVGYMVKHIDSIHHTVTLKTEDVVNALYTAVDARDLPGMADVDSSLILFCEEVKKDFKVALSGECADEIFGGYPWYRDPEIRAIDGFPWSQSTQFRSSFLKDEFTEGIEPLNYVYSRYRATVDSVRKNPLSDNTEQRMREMTELNLNWFMQTLLDRKDRMSMYNGLEVRVPFCDYRIVEYMYNVPWEMKDYKGREKGLLRYAVEGLLPEEILWRKKSPYPKTHNPLYLKLVKEHLQNAMNEPNAPLLDFVKKEELEKLFTADPDNFKTPWYGQLMGLPQTIAYFVQFNYWIKKYNIAYSD